jgi:curved DNA-binding protein CbpA
MDDISQAYRVLELEPGASLTEVNQSYKDLVFIWHPDRIPAEHERLREKAQDKLKQLNEARRVLRSHIRHGQPEPSVARPSYRSNPYQSAYRPSPYSHYGPPYRATPNYRSYQPDPSSTAAPHPPAGSPNNGHGSHRHPASNGHRPPSTDRPAADARSSGADPSVANGSSHRRPTEPPRSTYAAKSSAARQKPDLEGADFRGANLKEKDFSGRNLSKANLEGADLSDAFLHKVNLNQANLHRAKLFRANLLQANLSHANLREADLIGADLSGADLSGADLSGAKVGYGDKVMVKLTAANLTGTIMPNGTIHE